MWRILLLNRHRKPWDAEEEGDIGHIRARPGKFLCSIRESLGLPNSGEAADTFEKDWAGGFSSVNDYITITDLCVTALLFELDD